MAFVLSIVLVLIAGCSQSYQKDSLVVRSLPLTELAPIEALSLLKERHEGLRVLKGEGNFSLRYQGMDLKGKGVVWARRDSFRLDIFGPFLQPVYVIIYHEGVVSVLSLKEKKLYRGVRLYNPVFPIPVNPALFLSFIFGEFPSTLFGQDTLATKELVKGGIDENRGLYLLETLSKEGLRYKMWIHLSKKVMIEGEAYNSNGDMLSSVKREKFDNIDGNLFPRKITAKYTDGIVMSVDFRNVSLNENIDNDAFRLSLPPGIEEVNMLPIDTL